MKISNKKETKIILENWRKFISDENYEKNQLNEIDISSLAPIIKSGFQAISAYGIPTALAGIGLTASIKLGYQKMRHQAILLLI